MKSQTSLPIQYGAGVNPEISRGTEKNTSSSGATFQALLNENVIDVYERSAVNTSVPNERTGVDRRQSATRRQSSSRTDSLQSGKKVTDINISSIDQKINSTYTKAAEAAPAIFSPSQEKGRLLDIWA